MAVLRPGLKAKWRFWPQAAPTVAMLATAFLMTACAAPYVDSRREAGQLTPVGTSNPNRVAICYSKTATSTAEIEKLAESECAKTGRIPHLDHEDRWTCTMVAPRRIFYSCVAKP